ncbi:ESX-1 secretion-associated protein [Solihabitans fulvus]|uniref:ESX-1 secretion-associated protein n=1 Tax=Solihabitans fulvus TaxID=1892852 RepID=A0A5B2XQR4_9PSEU|nr:type VII secretion target [Solihabitans fulvus]KAA2265222.1 ESX-1 secretion-associated protein [Solihabitans fulvus]
MTEPNAFELDPAQLHEHANTVGKVADQLSSVAGGAPSGLADNALGEFVQFLAAGLQGAMSATTDVVTGAATSVEEMSTGLKQTANDYQQTDDGHAAALRWRNG